MATAVDQSFAGRTAFISGASRGIGLAIACALARRGANIAIAAKTAAPHPKLPGTIHTAAEAVEAAGGAALPLVVDIRDEAAVADAVTRTVERFGGVDFCINNASAIQLSGTVDTEPRRFDLMMSVNGRGSFVVTRACAPHLLASDHARILTIAPPLDFQRQWFRGHAAYTTAKYAMSLLSYGWAAEFEGRIGVNCLWPRTTIDTAAVRNLLGGADLANASRRPEIMGEAAASLLGRPVDVTGWFCLDDLVLAAAGETAFDRYSVVPGAALQPDFFVPADAPAPEAAAGRIGWRAPKL